MYRDDEIREARWRRIRPSQSADRRSAGYRLVARDGTELAAVTAWPNDRAWDDLGDRRARITAAYEAAGWHIADEE